MTITVAVQSKIEGAVAIPLEVGDPSSWSEQDAKDFLYAVAANADASLIASGGEEGVVRFYDGKTNQLIKAVTPK